MEKEAFDLHVLGTPPAFVLSQDQTLIKSSNNLAIVKLNCLLAYCLLVKNVCCLESIKTPYTFGLSLLCSVFKGLHFFFQQLLYLNVFLRFCQQLFSSFFDFVFQKCFSNSFIITRRLLFVNNFFEVFFDRIKLRKLSFFYDSVILSWCDPSVNSLFQLFSLAIFALSNK